MNAFTVLGSAVFLAVILLIPTIIRFVIKTFSSHPLKINVNFSIICLYLAVLVVLSVTIIFLPNRSLLKSENSDIMSETEENGLLLNMQKGNFSAPDGFQKAVIKFASKSKTIAINNPGTFSFCCATKGVDVPDNHDGKIDIYFYGKAATSYRDLYVNEPVDFPVASYRKNVLTFTNKEQQYVNHYAFYDRIAAGQFLGENNSDDGIKASSQQSIYILLPKGVKITGDLYANFSERIHEIQVDKKNK